MMELVTGGSGSGKSAYAENAVCQSRRRLQEKEKREIPLYYIADMFPYGRETEEKIENHRQMRAGKGFHTLEWYQDLAGKLTGEDAPDLSGACVLLECVSNLTANEMYMEGGAGENTVEAVVSGIRLLKERCRHLVVVTNEVFAESEPDSSEMAVYKKNLAQINRALAEMSDRVSEVVYGRRIPVKGDPRQTDGQKLQEQAAEERGRTGMKLVTGGAYQGKLGYAKELYPDVVWKDGAEYGLQDIETCEALDRFHLFVRRWLEAGRTKEELIDTVLKKNSGILIVCDEVGCGLVPVDAFEREYREAVGRICTAFADRADRVDRVVCGIGMRIK